MLDLYNNKYSLEILKENIYAISLLDILKTQIITAKFAAKYILNKKYQFSKEDSIIAPTVLLYQPHISYIELQKELLDYESDDDSVCDFETFANK